MNEIFELVKPDVGVVGLKLAKETREIFKRTAKSQGTTMQEVLETFIYLYNQNPSILVIRVSAEITPCQREA